VKDLGNNSGTSSGSGLNTVHFWGSSQNFPEGVSLKEKRNALDGAQTSFYRTNWPCTEETREVRCGIQLHNRIDLAYSFGEAALFFRAQK
jgi:hypothetical protein